DSGSAIRQACAEIRSVLIQTAAIEYNVDPASLSVRDGEISSSDGRVRTNYWALADEALLDREADGSVKPKSPDTHRIVGQSVPRIDLPDKVFGRPRFVHDLQLPGMLHGRIVDLASPRAKIVSVDDAAVKAMPGVVAVVRDGSFLGVIAEREAVAVKAAEKLAAAVRWEEGETLPDAANLAAFLTSTKHETTIVEERTPAQPATVVKRHKARFLKPYIAHASIGPSAAVACWADGSLEVWSHSQGIYNLRDDMAQGLRVPAERIKIHHTEGAGCYGHNGADDVAFEAALLARATPGRPVKLVWSRSDELGRSPMQAGHLVEVRAGTDASGNIVDWEHELWANGYSSRPGRADTPTLIAALHLEKPFPPFISINPPKAAGGGADRNSVPLYDFPKMKILNNRLLEMPIRTSALRGLGAYANIFALESFMDELAIDAGRDPIEYRLAHLSDPRGRAVIEAAVKRATWWRDKRAEGVGHGFAFARYKNLGAWCAVAAQIEAGATLKVRRLAIAVDVGQVINPDGVRNQVEGGAIQTVSWVLKEAVKFDRMRITSRSWEDYPILTFSEVPQIDIELINRPNERSLGAGEAPNGPAAAAIG
ncbi:MAG: molybdopterin cofactor-binding domain-containing protein, partial [Burkholderiales bacterium]